MDNELRLLRPDEVARLLSVSRSEVYRLIQLGRLPHLKLSERVLRIPERQLREFIHARVKGGGREEVER